MMTRAADLMARLDLLGEVAKGCVAARSSGQPLEPRGPALAEGLPEPLAAFTARGVRRVATELGAQPPVDSRVFQLGRDAQLTAFDREVLLAALAPDLVPSIGSVYAELQEGARSVTTSLALILTGTAAHNGAARHRVGEDGPLARAGLIEVGGEAHHAPLGRVLRVPVRVQHHLLGVDVPPASLAGSLVAGVSVPGSTADAVAGGLAAGSRIVYVHDADGGAGAGAAVAAIRALGGGGVVLDGARINAGTGLTPELARTAAREALLRGAGLVVVGIEVLAGNDAAAVQLLVQQPGPLVLVGRTPWDPEWAVEVPLQVEAQRLDQDVRARLWRQALGAEDSERIGAAEVARGFRLTPGQLWDAANAAQQRARSQGRELTANDIQAGARAQNTTHLARLARRLTPSSSWEELVLPEEAAEGVRDVALRWRHRDQVLDTWGLQRGAGRGRGVTGLFTGPPGTGKTLSAAVIAADLGLDLYVVELSTVVDKYIGETSKNLERIFDAADRVNGVLLFDEADALFGKRSAVSDAKDRHANVEVAYLLQRMEAFDGIAILTTNLASNLDEAFLRRLDVVVDFPSPDAAQRLRLWQSMLPADLPMVEEPDLADLAERFRLTGAEISNVVATAAYRVAANGTPLATEDLVRATVREHQKSGRKLTAYDLGPWSHLLGV